MTLQATRRGLIVGAGAAMAAPGLGLAAAPDDGPLPEDGYYEIIEPQNSDRLWLIRQAKPFHLQPIGNVTVIDQADGLVMVDCGGSPGSGRRIVNLIRSVSAKPVKAVILTHWHGDHPLGLAEILKAWPGARTIATVATRAHLSEPATMNTPATFEAKANAALVARYRGFADYCRQQSVAATTDADRAGWAAGGRLFNQYARDMDGAVTIAPREGFTDELVIDDRDQPVVATFLGRANTDGDAIVRLPRQGLLITGDLVVAPVPFAHGSYPSEWLAALKTLINTDWTRLIPGHGAPMNSSEHLLRVGALLEAAIAGVRALPPGTTLADARAKLDFSARGRWFTGGDPWLDRWFKSYWSDPVVASAWKEANGLPIRQSLGGD
jgi:glyoxylase-like metal-dependent hydrolase (beta-lactamase superfamily II)